MTFAPILVVLTLALIALASLIHRDSERMRKRLDEPAPELPRRDGPEEKSPAPDPFEPMRAEAALAWLRAHGGSSSEQEEALKEALKWKERAREHSRAVAELQMLVQLHCCEPSRVKAFSHAKRLHEQAMLTMTALESYLAILLTAHVADRKEKLAAEAERGANG